MEARSFSEALETFDKLNVAVLGVSTDDLNSHQDFQVNCEIDVGMIADTDGAVARAYGAMSDSGLCHRVSYDAAAR